MQTIFIVVVALLVIVNVVATVVALRSETSTTAQRMFQACVVWLIPLLGAFVMILFHRLDRRSQVQKRNPCVWMEVKVKSTLDWRHVHCARQRHPWGTIQYIATGQAGAWPTTDAAIYDKLVDVVHSLRPRYRQRAQWLMPTEAIAKLRKMKDGQGNPIWQPSTTEGQPDRLLGYPVNEAEQMPAIGANSLSVAFADWQRAYWIVDRLAVRVLRDPYTAKPNVVFYTTKRTIGGVANSSAIKLLKFSAT